MALMFFPRGGSAQVARYMARALPRAGWEVTLVSGSLGAEGEESNARTFFADAPELHPVDYTEALDAPDPLLADPPFHPSFEDRPGAPDRIFAGVDEETYEHLVSAWERELAAAGAGDADVIHLHHLTPMNEAAERAFPDVPRIGHLHGTELLMLREIDEGLHPGWAHAEEWAERMRGWARACERLFVLSPDAVRRVPALLGVDAERVVWAPNGFDPVAFDRRPLEQQVTDHRDETSIHPGRGRAGETHAELLRRRRRLGVEVEDDLHVVGDETDRHQHRGRGAGGMQLPEAVVDVRLQPRDLGGARP